MVKVAYKESGQPGEYAHKVLSEANIRDLLGFLMITPEFSFRGKETNGKDTYFRFSCDKPGTFADLEVTVSYG